MSDEKYCKVCGEQCEEVGTARHNRAWICRDCGVKYFDRDKEEYRPFKYAVTDGDGQVFVDRTQVLFNT